MRSNPASAAAGDPFRGLGSPHRPPVVSGAAVITGAASGLGLALADRLAARGWRLALVDLPDAALRAETAWQEADAAARAGGGGVIAAPFDVRDAAAWAALRTRLEAAWPACDLLVNAAGVGAAGAVGTLPAEQWRRVIDTNLVGTALGCETFLPWLAAAARRSHVVNVASIAGVLAPPSMAAYSASKAGVIALSEAIAAEGPRGRPGVTVACPGFFRSGLLDTWHFASAVESREARRRMGRTAWTSGRVADSVLAAVAADRRYVVVGTEARWLWRLKRMAPRATTAVLAGMYRRLAGDGGGGRPVARTP
jgi:NAD(P)-dependent dehydrogenase (short-subunit alcohol dehydrogenase family)